MNRDQRRTDAKPGQATAFPGVDDVLGAGVAHHQAGRLAEAEACYRRVLAAQPNHADALNMLGALAHQVGRSDVAVDLIRRAIEINGNNPGYFYHLGCALQGQGKPDEAVAAFRQTVRLEPDLADDYNNIGNISRSQGKLDDAVAAYRDAVRIKPGMAEFRFNLGIGLKEQGKLDEAATAYRQAIQIKPGYAEAHCYLGMALREQGRLEEAANACRQAIGISPALAEAHCNLGITLWQQGKLGEAILACRQAIRLKPDHAAAHCALGNALLDQGELGEAIAAYGQALKLQPNLAGWHSNLVLCLNYDERVAAAALLEAHRDWVGRHAWSVSWLGVHANDRSAERRLKVGYVSPDFRSHSVAHFLEPLLRSHDRSAIEVFCYAEVNWPDARTERFRQLADHWTVTVGMPDEALADRIRDDGIDVLVDLAGHTAKNRLLVFARKPAPVQVTWLGYPNTTGLSAMDYRLVDAVTDPVGDADAFASETLVRLPGGFLCYDGPADAPAPAAPPCLATGTVTFGSFNSAAKLSGATLDAWAALLARLPAARLLLKGKAFADPATCASFLVRLGTRGVAAQRVELSAYVPQAEHFAAYGRVDIALDPFPYNGTTTPCEALWMGVPVVTLRGDRHAGRVGASLLTQLGLTDLIAGSIEEYVEIAVALAGDPARLADLRRSLRPRMEASELCDAAAFARKIEAAYRTVWKDWCRQPAESALRYFSQQGEDCLIARFFGFKPHGFFVDIGAFDGKYLSNTYFFEQLGWSGVCVEAYPPYFDLCVKNRPGSKCHQVACLDRDRGMIDFRAERGGLFSGVEVDEQLVASFYQRNSVPFDGYHSIKVPTSSLDALLPAGTDQIDFVSIVVEGAELQVLAGFDLERHRPRILVMEANDPAQRQAIDDHLGPRGYRLARSMGWNHFYVRTPEDALALCSIDVRTTLERPAHPLGRIYNRMGDAVPPIVHWPPTRPS